MTPIKLVMKNIGPFSGTVEVDFSKYKGIFLIAGDTGAGKTTILDAICYAFFGRTPSFSKQGQSRKNFLSDFVDEADAESFVDFTFSIYETGIENTYRIYRTVPKDKNSLDVCKLFSINAGDAEDKVVEFVGKKTEVENKIAELIKLSYDEFSKIILLPQGAFSDFIKQNSTQKVEILKDIFDVKKFTDFIEKVSAEDKTKRAEVNHLETQIKKMQETYNDNNYESIEQESRETLQLLKLELGQITKRLEIKKTEKFQAEILEEKKKEFALEMERFEKIKSDESEIESLKEKVDKAQKVLPLIVQVKNISALENEKNTLENKLTDVIDASNASEQKLSELINETTTAYIEEQKLLREKLIRREDRLQQAMHIYEHFVGCKKKYAELRNLLLPKKDEYENKTKRIAELKNEMEPLNTEIEKIGEYSSQVENQKAKLDRLKQSAQMLKEYSEKKLTLNATKINLQNCEQQLSLLEKNILIETEELQNLKKQKEKSEQSVIAVRLASVLKENAPCPVCGSMHHPSPASTEQLSSFSYDDRIAKSETAVKNFNLEKTFVFEKAIMYREKCNALLDNVADLENQLALIGVLLPVEQITEIDISEAYKEIETCSDELNLALKKLATSKQAIEKKAMIEQRIKSLELTVEKYVVEVTELERTLTELDAAIKADTKQLKNILPDDFDIAKVSPEVELEKILDEKEKLTRQINAHQENVQELKTKLERQKTQIEENKIKLDALTLQLESKSIEFENDCARFGIEKENVLKFFLNEAVINEHIKTISQFTENKIASTEKLKSLKSELDNAPDLNIEEIERNILQDSAQLDELQERLILTTEKLTTLNKAHTQYIALCKEHEAAVNEANAIKKLCDKISGNNAKKLKFDTWRISHLFQQVIIFANKRFTAISNDRYFLELSEDAQNKHGFAGLDLLVYDSHTGKTRFVSTLSGGETFIASVCIALGLADTLTANAGGIRINSMFIDEGFGSLDSENLARVFDNLDLVTKNESLQLLGIISHVSELENRIVQKLRVIKTSQGSRIEQ